MKSIINHLMSNSKSPEPFVGMGATALSASDRHAFTVVKIVGAKTIVVQEDDAKRTDNNGMSDQQSYEYTPNPEAPRITVTLRKDGRWVEKGGSIRNGRTYVLGFRRKYHDFSY